MISEIGKTTGTVSTGAGSTDVVAIIAYGLLGVVILVCVTVLVRLHGGQ